MYRKDHYLCISVSFFLKFRFYYKYIELNYQELKIVLSLYKIEISKKKKGDAIAYRLWSRLYTFGISIDFKI